MVSYYKYGTVSKLEWLEALILRHQLYVPTLSELNDPCEGLWAPGEKGVWNGLLEIATAPADPLYKLFLFGSQVQSGSEQASFGDKVEALQDVLEFRRRLAQPRVGVVCMSKRYNNFSLWAKYANDHKGYCLEFSDSGTFSASREVVYEDFGAWSKNHQDFLFRKSLDWCNEQEVRYVSSDTSGGLMTLAAGDLTRIILGERMPAEQKAAICGWAAARTPALPVATASFGHYGLRLSLRPVS